MKNCYWEKVPWYKSLFLTEYHFINNITGEIVGVVYKRGYREWKASRLGKEYVSKWFAILNEEKYVLSRLPK